jgi:hypothetical protein
MLNLMLLKHCIFAIVADANCFVPAVNAANDTKMQQKLYETTTFKNTSYIDIDPEPIMTWRLSKASRSSGW